jgi:hypothetical protein
MERVAIPDIELPFPSQLNLLVEVVQEHTVAWAMRHRLVRHESAIRRFRAAHFGWLTARAYPTAGYEDLAIIADWSAWLFMFDDQLDDGRLGKDPQRLKPLLDGLLHVLDAPSDVTPGTPIAESLFELWLRMIPRTTAAWHQRFRRDVAGYFAAYLWEASNRALGTVPELEAFIARRRDAGGVRTAFDLIDLAEHLHLPPEVYEQPDIQRLTDLANDVVCWVNDIVSFSKEHARGEVNNLVIIMQQTQRGSFQEAADRVAGMISDEIGEFIDREQHLPSFAPALDQRIETYLAGLRAWMRGNLDWARESRRYSDVEQTQPGEEVSYLEPILAPSRRAWTPGRRQAFRRN